MTTLTITLGNDATQTGGDLAVALELIADRVRSFCGATAVQTNYSGIQTDGDGATVCQWAMSPRNLH